MQGLVAFPENPKDCSLGTLAVLWRPFLRHEVSPALLPRSHWSRTCLQAENEGVTADERAGAESSRAAASVALVHVPQQPLSSALPQAPDLPAKPCCNPSSLSYSVPLLSRGLCFTRRAVSALHQGLPSLSGSSLELSCNYSRAAFSPV